MTRNLELVQGLIHTRHRGVQVNTVQDWSPGQLCCSEPGHGAGCAGGAVSGTAGWHRAAQGSAGQAGTEDICSSQIYTRSCVQR